MADLPQPNDFPLATAEGRAARVALLAAERFRPLEEYRCAIAARYGSTPHVDPLDGGTAARVLLLLETPGPRGPTPRFVSCDNATGTARNLTRFLAQAGIERRGILLWNAVPWIIHAEGARNRPPRPAEVAGGLALLPGLLDLLPHLRGVVLAGRVAQRAKPCLAQTRGTLACVCMPHPSPTYVNTAPAVAERIGDALAAVRSICLS